MIQLPSHITLDYHNNMLSAVDEDRFDYIAVPYTTSASHGRDNIVTMRRAPLLQVFVTLVLGRRLTLRCSRNIGLVGSHID